MVSWPHPVSLLLCQPELDVGVPTIDTATPSRLVVAVGFKAARTAAGCAQQG
jgi:hypothetical protein